MSRQDKTTEATLRMLQGAPAPSIAPGGRDFLLKKGHKVD